MNILSMLPFIWFGLGGCGLFLSGVAAKKNPNSEVGQRVIRILAHSKSLADRRVRSIVLMLLIFVLGPLMLLLALIIYTGYGQENDL